MNSSNSYFQDQGQWVLEAKPLPVVQEETRRTGFRRTGLVAFFWISGSQSSGQCAELASPA